MSGPARVGVLIVSYGSHALVAEALSKTALPDGAFAVVVDNLTSPEERERMRELSRDHGWELVEPDRNLGFGAGMNAAAERARSLGADAYVLLNPDAHIEGDGVATLSRRVLADPDLLLSPLVVRPGGAHFSSLMEVDLETGELRRVRAGARFARSALWVSGACVAVSAALWERVGGFDDDYFLYWEDVDLSLRVAEVGGHVEVDDGVRAVHSPGGTQHEVPVREKSPTYYYFNTRNRLVFAAKHLGRAGARAWRRRAVAAAYAILLRGGRRQFLRPASSIWPALRGTLAGLRFERDSRRRGEAS